MITPKVLTGTIAKSKMLCDVHPDISKMVWKFSRWHHKVDYSAFKKNKLIRRTDIEIPSTPNNYGMKLVEIPIEKKEIRSEVRR